MTARELIQAVAAAGGCLAAEGDRLDVEAPKPLPDALVAELRRHKTAILAELTGRMAMARKFLRAVAEAGGKVTLRDGRPWVTDSPSLPPGLLELLHAHAAEILALLREELDWRGRRAQFYIHHGMVWGKERYDRFYRSYWRARDLKLTYEDAVLLAFLDARPLREPFTLYEEPLPAWLQERPL